ncbi:50S ribosomal protein L3 [candidate division WWE3 bacterium]|nr:50S ribosomal protein L3 [candidate division WWE3 bacterium]
MKLEGKKLQMSQVFLKDGTVIPVTLVSVVSEFDDSLLGRDVLVSGTSKGKGFTGVVKKYGFKGGPATHGQSDRHRAPGASSSTTTPGRVFKGTRRSGRHGNKKVTLKGLKIVEIDLNKKQLKISGPLPGGRNSQVFIETGE